MAGFDFHERDGKRFLKADKRLKKELRDVVDGSSGSGSRSNWADLAEEGDDEIATSAPAWTGAAVSEEEARSALARCS